MGLNSHRPTEAEDGQAHLGLHVVLEEVVLHGEARRQGPARRWVQNIRRVASSSRNDAAGWRNNVLKDVLSNFWQARPAAARFMKATEPLTVAQGRNKLINKKRGSCGLA